MLVKTIIKRSAVVFGIMLFMTSVAVPHDYIPGSKQANPVLIRGGNLFTVSGAPQPQTDILFENGVITSIGKNLTAPANAEIIEAAGMNVYPGLIAANSSLGLTEIGAVRATNDRSEIGAVTPEVSTRIAYNPDSELIPSVRSNGITTAQIIPGGSLLRGRSNILNLDGWTREDMTVRKDDGMFLAWPSVSINTAWWESRTPEKQKEQMAEARKRLRTVFDDARAYWKAKKTDPSIDIDLRWEAMIPVFEKKTSLFISGNDYRQIEEAVQFCEEQELRMILVSGAEAYKLTDLLKDKNVPVIVVGSQGLPMRRGDGYDETFRLPYKLNEAGVTWCMSNGGSWSQRNLPFQAGTAVAHGLTPDQALRSITLSVAEILGIDKEVGSLEVGKKATLIISDGDIMDHLTHNVTHMWIEGRRVDLDNRHKELFRKYEQKPFPAN